MKTLHRRCAGLDVHSDTVVACARLTVYWKPIWHMLEGRFELVLANAAHIPAMFPAARVTSTTRCGSPTFWRTV